MMADVKAREYALEREQKAWRLEKTVLEREVPRLKAEKTTLAKLTKDAQTRLEGLQRAISGLLTANTNLKEKAIELETNLVKKHNKLDKLTEKAIELETKLENRKNKANDEVEAYYEKAKLAADRQLGKIQQEMADTLEELDKIKIQIASYESTIRETKVAASQATSVLRTYEVSISLKKKTANEEMLTIADELSRLQGELQTLRSQKADITQEYIEMQTAIDKFKAYEKRAWQLLQTKDTELQGREAALLEKEALRPVSRSFLPPVK